MKLPIKFRGRTDDGQICFGDYCFSAKYPAIRDYERRRYMYVAPDSVKQLCGYDADGNEVYEDDIVFIDKDGYYREYVAHLKGYATNPKDGCYITLDGKFDARLKEESA